MAALKITDKISQINVGTANLGHPCLAPSATTPWRRFMCVSFIFIFLYIYFLLLRALWTAWDIFKNCVFLLVRYAAGNIKAAAKAEIASFLFSLCYYFYGSCEILWSCSRNSKIRILQQNFCKKINRNAVWINVGSNLFLPQICIQDLGVFCLNHHFLNEKLEIM